MRCPRCGHQEDVAYRYCPDCWLEVNPTAEAPDARVAMFRRHWEHAHPDRVKLYDDWAPAPGVPPPGESDPLPAPDRRPPFKALDARLQAVILVFAAYAAYELLVIVSDFLEINLVGKLEHGDFTGGQVTSNDNRQHLVRVGEVALLIPAAIVWIRWFSRAYENVPAVGGAQRYGAGWAIGGWFVPLVSLARPKQIANDIWWATGRDPDGLLWGWWAAWVVSSIASGFVGRAGVDTVAQVRTRDIVDVIGSVLVIVAAALACRVAARGTQRLEAARTL